ncbi:Protein SMG7 [Cytospora mali]|uniref:Protein SMG7 n=1 Tax=Cytospora mali TaxID=578113 RepID=A0A194VG51_CYTMA|nr:Protein SMG7 [Valsa mali var. pyri (nom. inval.)]
MLTFIYLAYSMMALLYETVPAFEDTWIECLGDLGRYRMAIEDEDIRDREIWTAVSRHWYSKASDKAPTTGRLHHHLAILARPNVVQQLFYYTKSLCVAIPFKSARDSILTLFDPILEGTPNRLQQIDVAFVKTHGILFIVSNTDEKEKPFPKPIESLMTEYGQTKQEFLSLLDNHIARTTRGWLESGAFIAISNCNSIFEYGKTEANSQGNANIAMTAILPEPDGDTIMEGFSNNEHKAVPSKVFGEAAELNKDSDIIVLRRYGDPNILPYLHVRLAFMLFMATKESAMKYLEGSFPWALLVLMLNSLSTHFDHHDRIESMDFPQSTNRPLPDDWSLRGLLWTEKLFPSDWFSDKVDDDEKTFELPSMTEDRKERVLWLGYKLASYGKWMTYDEQTKLFSVTAQYDDLEAYKYPNYAPSGDTTIKEKDSTSSRSSTLGSTTTLDQSSSKWLSEEGDGGRPDADEEGTAMGLKKADAPI